MKGDLASRGEDESVAPYSAVFLAHLRSPRRAGAWPRATPDIVTGEAWRAGEEPRIRLQLRVSPAGRIRESRFQAFGCAATLACASYVADAVAGRRVAEVAALEAAAVAAALELEPERRPAAVLAVGALRAALRQLGA